MLQDVIESKQASLSINHLRIYIQYCHYGNLSFFHISINTLL